MYRIAWSVSLTNNLYLWTSHLAMQNIYVLKTNAFQCSKILSHFYQEACLATFALARLERFSFSSGQVHHWNYQRSAQSVQTHFMHFFALSMWNLVRWTVAKLYSLKRKSGALLSHRTGNKVLQVDHFSFSVLNWKTPLSSVMKYKW